MSEREFFTSGYCFRIDSARTVGIVIEDNTLTDCDCDYRACENRTKCQIGKAITKAVENPEEV